MYPLTVPGGDLVGGLVCSLFSPSNEYISWSFSVAIVKSYMHCRRYVVACPIHHGQVFTQINTVVVSSLSPLAYTFPLRRIGCLLSDVLLTPPPLDWNACVWWPLYRIKQRIYYTIVEWLAGLGWFIEVLTVWWVMLMRFERQWTALLVCENNTLS